MAWVPLVPVDAREDVLHPAGEDPAWSEHHYFFFADAATGIGGGCRVAWRVEERLAKGSAFGFVPEGVALWQGEGTNDRLSVGSLAFEGERLGEWRVRFGASALLLRDTLALAGLGSGDADTASIDLEWDLAFAPASPAVGADPAGPGGELIRRIAPRRFEQCARVTGRARVGAKEIDVSGFGTRDHSWGARRAEGLREWKWCTMPLGDELCGGAGHVVLDDGEIRSGWLSRHGALAAVRDASVEYEFGSGGVVPRAVRVSLLTDDGAREFLGEVVCPLGMRVVEHGRAVLAVESLTRYRAEDGTEGYGIAEYVRTL